MTELFNIDAEKGFLGCVMVREDGKRVLSLVQRDDLYREAHRLIYDAFVIMAKERTPIGNVTLTAQLKASGTLEAIGGESCITSLMSERWDMSVDFPEHYAKIIRDNAALRRVKTTLQDSIARLEEDGMTADRLWSTLREQSGAELLNNSKDVQELNSLLDKMVEDLQKRREQVLTVGTAAVGLPTGNNELDTLLGGLQKGIHLLAAQPGQGKTTLALQWAHSAIRADYPVLFITFDESADRIGLKVICQAAGLNMKDYNEGRADLGKFDKAIDDYGYILFKFYVINGTGNLSPSQVGAMASKIMKQHGKDKILVIVDYLQRWAAGRRSTQGREHRLVVDNLISEIREESLALDSPFLIISSQSKDDAGKPGLMNAKESGEVSYAADTFMCLADGDAKGALKGKERAIKLTVNKNRYGDTNTKGLGLIFDPATGRFTPDK